MTKSQTRAAVHELYGAYERRDVERFTALIHDDIDWMIYGPISIFPFAGPRQGRQQVLDALKAIEGDYAVEAYRPEVIVVDGDRAAVMSDVTFRQKSSNRILRFRIADFLRFADGKVIEFREFSNTFDVVEQALGRELPL